MPEPITIVGSFLGAVPVGSLLQSGLYDVAKRAATKLLELIAADLRQGKLPANHDLYRLASDSLQEALQFAHAACASEIGEKQPYFSAVMTAWKVERPPSQRKLLGRRSTAGSGRCGLRSYPVRADPSDGW